MQWTSDTQLLFILNMFAFLLDFPFFSYASLRDNESCEQTNEYECKCECKQRNDNKNHIVNDADYIAPVVVYDSQSKQQF